VSNIYYLICQKTESPRYSLLVFGTSWQHRTNILAQLHIFFVSMYGIEKKNNTVNKKNMIIR